MSYHGWNSSVNIILGLGWDFTCLPKMLKVAKWVNTDLLKDFTVLQMVKKLDWPEFLVW